MKRYVPSIVILVLASLSLITNWYSQITIALAVLLLIILLDKLGKGIVLRETIAFLYTFTCLVMPVIGYNFYDRSNTLAKIWVRYMPVSAEAYFTYAIPAISVFCFALTFPFSSINLESAPAIRQINGKSNKKAMFDHRTGLVIIAVGILISFAIPVLPSGLQFFATLFFFGTFAGMLYIYFAQDFRYKYLLMTLFAIFIIYNAISVGMFTIVAYMGITIFSFLMLGKKTSLIKKIMFFSIAAFMLIVLQNVKLSYRKYIWRSGYEGSKVALFSKIFVENIQKGDALIEKDAFFQIYIRGNQGYNVALVMRNIPAIKPFNNGSLLITGFLSAFVPRFLWPDKPEAGGKFNMQYYAGWRISGWSTNVGPLGEGYGSFGVAGGIIYMFFLGLFIRWFYMQIFRLAKNIPLLICWLPVIFFQIISSAETDSLQIFNSLIKASLFVWILYKFLPSWFGKRKNMEASGLPNRKILLEPSEKQEGLPTI